MSDYEFTQQWFGAAEQVWPHLVDLLPAHKSFLEIGSFEGRSTVWTVQHMVEDGGRLIAVDTWEGSEEHGPMGINMEEAEARFDANILQLASDYPKRTVEKIKKTSTEALAEMQGKRRFDFIYIDGSHTAPDVLTDACMAWPLLWNEGIMVFDDYLWGDARDALHRPKIAIDAFTTIFGESLKIIHSGYQLIVQKHGD